MLLDLLQSSYFSIFLIVALGFMLGRIKIEDAPVLHLRRRLQHPPIKPFGRETHDLIVHPVLHPQQ